MYKYSKYIYTQLHTYGLGWGWANANKVQLGGFRPNRLSCYKIYVYNEVIITFLRMGLRSSSPLLGPFQAHLYLSLSTISFSHVADSLFVSGFSFVEIKYALFFK